jgi:hypothetical protein
MRLVAGHGVHDSQHFTHASCNGNLEQFSLLSKVIKELPNDWIMFNSGQTGHVQHSTHTFSPTKDTAFAAFLTTIAIEGSQAS